MAQVLNEGVPRADHSCAAEPFEARSWREHQLLGTSMASGVGVCEESDGLVGVCRPEHADRGGVAGNGAPLLHRCLGGRGRVKYGVVVEG
jgi:hypothetical protein